MCFWCLLLFHSFKAKCWWSVVSELLNCKQNWFKTFYVTPYRLGFHHSHHHKVNGEVCSCLQASLLKNAVNHTHSSEHKMLQDNPLLYPWPKGTSLCVIFTLCLDIHSSTFWLIFLSAHLMLLLLLLVLLLLSSSLKCLLNNLSGNCAKN